MDSKRGGPRVSEGETFAVVSRSVICVEAVSDDIVLLFEGKTIAEEYYIFRSEMLVRADSRKMIARSTWTSPRTGFAWGGVAQPKATKLGVALQERDHVHWVIYQGYYHE
jgi:hypothetical protein